MEMILTESGFKFASKTANKPESLFVIDDIIKPKLDDQKNNVTVNDLWRVVKVVGYDKINGYTYCIEPESDEAKAWAEANAIEGEGTCFEICGFENSPEEQEWVLANESKSIKENKDEQGLPADKFTEYDLLNLDIGTRVDVEDMMGKIHSAYVVGSGDKSTILLTFDEYERLNADTDDYQEVSISNIVRVYNDDLNESKSIREAAKGEPKYFWYVGSNGVGHHYEDEKTALNAYNKLAKDADIVKDLEVLKCLETPDEVKVVEVVRGNSVNESKSIKEGKSVVDFVDEIEANKNNPEKCDAIYREAEKTLGKYDMNYVTDIYSKHRNVESKSINEGHQVQTYKGYELDWNEDGIDPEEGVANFDVYITKDGKIINNKPFNGFRAAREYIDELSKKPGYYKKVFDELINKISVMEIKTKKVSDNGFYIEGWVDFTIPTYWAIKVDFNPESESWTIYSSEPDEINNNHTAYASAGVGIDKLIRELYLTGTIEDINESLSKSKSIKEDADKNYNPVDTVDIAVDNVIENIMNSELGNLAQQIAALGKGYNADWCAVEADSPTSQAVVKALENLGDALKADLLANYNKNESLKESIEDEYASITALADDCGENVFKEFSTGLRFRFINDDNAIKFMDKLREMNITFDEMATGVIRVDKVNIVSESFNDEVSEYNEHQYKVEKRHVYKRQVRTSYFDSYDEAKLDAEEWINDADKHLKIYAKGLTNSAFAYIYHWNGTEFEYIELINSETIEKERKSVKESFDYNENSEEDQGLFDGIGTQVVDTIFPGVQFEGKEMEKLDDAIDNLIWVYKSVKARSSKAAK